MSLTHPGRPAPGWRWIKAWLWSLERAFEKARTSGRAENDARIRILVVLAFFVAGFLCLAVGATRLAIFPGLDVATGARGGPGPARAPLVDRRGALLAADLPFYTLYLDPRDVWDRAETRAGLLKALPDLSVTRLDRAMAASRRTFLAGPLSPADRDRVHDLGLPGVVFEREPRRVYPLGGAGAHLIGFSDTGGEGLAGAEGALNERIRAGAGDREPTPLSIDMRVQAALDDELSAAATRLQAKGAVGLITNVQTGEVLAMSSWPTFDPNHAGGSTPDQLRNRAVASVYEMGSTFKVFTLAVGLDTHKITPETLFHTTKGMNIGSRVIRDLHAVDHDLTATDIFLKSSNIGASQIALAVGGPAMTQYFQAFGLSHAAPIELNESARPILPREWNPNTVASASFGHAISVSPVALAAGLGSVLNGGRYLPLTVQPMQSGARPDGRRIISEETSRQMLGLMRRNVLEGSGRRANAAGLRVGGKTGSAEKVIEGRYVRDKVLASFAGVFPTDGALGDDRYLVLVLIDEPVADAESGGRTGGLTAAPTAGKIIDRVAPFLGVTRRFEQVAAQPVPANAELAALQER
ncbi:MAG: penicillin-binding protein 2 [Phenylobacterium sp.]|uniref:peptidoglycan D,D-transpeptidase FtsI family protein n=1 Tax=Phenylobacterium sp. TaxID=1871053 RepID=UPI0025EAB085|nr:penicillin-binding protein 2 [Phenylobacterium sp.]MCA6299774.1 penicillin-binding protein 2 [Phenylobacterium sp.]